MAQFLRPTSRFSLTKIGMTVGAMVDILDKYFSSLEYASFDFFKGSETDRSHNLLT